MVGRWIKNPTSQTTMIFLHGILSSSDACWQHENGTYWPELIAEERQSASIGVYEFSYKTGVFSGTYRLGDVVDALKEHMQLDGVTDSRRLIFVCHSMGGIVARKFIVERSLDLTEDSTCVGMFLIASPSLGSDYANWLAPLANLFGHTQADALRFSQNNTWLMDLDREFLNLKESEHINIFGKELAEDKSTVLKTLLRKQVVQPFSGARYFGDPFKVPDSDHSSIAKIDGIGAVQHRLLLKFLEEFGEFCEEKQKVQEHLAEHEVVSDKSTAVEESLVYEPRSKKMIAVAKRNAPAVNAEEGATVNITIGVPPKE